MSTTTLGTPDLEARTSKSRQRELPLDDAGHAAEVRAWLREGVLEIELRDLDDPREDLNASLDIARAKAPRVCKAGGVARWMNWSMERHAQDFDFFCKLDGWAVARSRAERSITDDEHRGSPRRKLIAPLRELLRRLRREALEACRPKLLQVARRFASSSRYRIYRQLNEDDSGRLAQIVDAVPGLLVLAAGMDSIERRDELPPDFVRDRIARGQPVNALLDELLAAWLPCWAGWRVRVENVPLAEAIPPWGLSEEARRRRLLVRRASSLVDHWDLMGASTLALAPEDIPAEARANARWFSVMAELRFSKLSMLDERAPDVHRFVSRHFADVTTISCGTSVADYVKATNRVPTRRSNGLQYLSEVKRWTAVRRSLQEKLDLRGGTLPLMCASEDDVFALSLPSTPLNGTSNGLVIEPITTPQALFDEGRVMHHCVGGRLERAVDGDYALYHARFGEERLTFSLTRSGDGWSLEECRGFANAEPSWAALDAIRRTVAGANAQSDVDESRSC